MPQKSSAPTRLGLALGSSAMGAFQPLVLVFAFQLGASRLVGGHNPINFCNGLLFGNAFSLVTLLLLRYAQRNRSQQRKAWKWVDGARVLLPVLCGALLEAGTLIALSRVEAIRVAMVLTMTSVVLMVGEAIAKRRWPRLGVSGGVVLVVAASLLISSNEAGKEAAQAMAPIGLALLPNTGQTNALLLLGLLALNVIYYQSSSPLATDLGELNFSIWQTTLYTLIFLIWASTTFGFPHIYDLRSPLLWQVMLLYGAVLSSAYTLLESAALAKAGPLLMSLFEGLLPLLSGLFAWLLLKQPLTPPLIAGGAAMAVGLACIELSDSTRTAV